MCTEHDRQDRPPCLIHAGEKPRRKPAAAAMQCNPLVAGLAVALALVIMAAGEIRAHETGIIQALRGAAAGALMLAVLSGLHYMARWVHAQDAPQPEALKTDHVTPLTLTADEPSVVTPRTPGEDEAIRAAMAADADALATGQLDLVFTAGERLYELDDREDEDAI